ncbi:MAG: FAD-binding oxidoreductase [Planctomycetota bacterium]|nr:FAD-binding oxidoreductase [Planctomycetota bacterium]
MRARILIVGGGVMGTAIALKAAQRADPLSQPVVLLERSELAAGSSGRSGAILRQLYADPEVAVMARESLREYAGFETRTLRPIGFRRTGVLSLAGPAEPEWIERLERMIADLISIGIEIQRVEADEIRKILPGVRVHAETIGAWEQGGGVVDPRKTVDAFAALARTYGAITRIGAGVRAIVVEGGCVARVETDEGVYEAEQVVICAGPWSRRLLADAGVDLPLRVVRPENHFLGLPTSYRDVDALEGDEESPESGVDLEDPLEKISEQLSGPEQVEGNAHPVLIDLEAGFYARCEATEHRTRVGRVDYDHDDILEDPDELDEDVTDELRTWAREALCNRMPVYQREADLDSLAAWYTLTPDAQAIIGPVPGVEGLYVVTGFSGHGFKLAPSVGEGVAQMLFGETVSAFDPDFFSPARFAGAEKWTGAFGL